MPARDQIENRVQQFVVELDRLIRQAALEAVEAALGSGPRTRKPAVRVRAATAPAIPTATATPTPPPSGRRSSREIGRLAVKMAAYVTHRPGQRIGDIAAAVGAPSRTLGRPMANLVASGRIRRRGTRGGARYFPA